MEEVFYPQNNGEISGSITQSWTEQALDCSKCSLKNGNYSFKCQMPKVIDILINVAGRPQTI